MYCFFSIGEASGAQASRSAPLAHSSSTSSQSSPRIGMYEWTNGIHTVFTYSHAIKEYKIVKFL